MALHADPTLTLIPVRWIMTFSISKHGEFFNLQSFLGATIVLVTIIKRWGYTSSWRQQDGLSPLVSPFTGSVSKTALWIDSKLIFTCSKHDVRRQKKKPWDIKKAPRCMFLIRNWKLIQNDKSCFPSIIISWCSYSFGSRCKQIRFQTSKRQSDLSLHWRFVYEKKNIQLKNNTLHIHVYSWRNRKGMIKISTDFF